MSGEMWLSRRKARMGRVSSQLFAGYNKAIAAAKIARANALMAVAEGLVSIWDILQMAAIDIPLRKISLQQLLAAQPGWGMRRAEKVISDTLAFSERETHAQYARRATIGWLLDNRSGGGRYRAFVDAVLRTDATEPPWPGYPYSPHNLGV